MNKSILKLAIPNIISNITVPMLGLVDLAILGHLESEIYIGAIALGSLVFNFIYFGFGFLRMSTSGFTAQAVGKDDSKEVILVLSRSLFTAFSGSFLIILLQIPIAFISFSLMEGSPEVELLAREYFFIRIYAAPATLGLFALTGWFLGMQNAKFPMILALIINVLNLGLNLIFIYGLGLKSDGVAWGTLIAQYAGFICGSILFYRYYKNYISFWNRKAMMQFEALKKFVVVNRDILIRTLLLLFAISFFTAQSAKIGDTTLAVNTLLFQYFFIFSYLIDGFAHAAEALVGKYFGAKDFNTLKKIISRIFLFGFIISLIFTAIYVFAGKYLLFILTDNEKIINQAADYLIWVGIIPVITFAAFLWDGIFIGATATSQLRNAMIISTLLIFLPSYFLTFQSFANNGLWFSLLLFMASRSVILTIFYFRKSTSFLVKS
ncbi:MAG: MATE family efflux transporter [Bacteroidales bacterium]|nr:MATE family efflux transporter [Bacteroidales bacterium]